MKRRVMLLLLLLVGGAIVNVAVAWGSAAWVECLADFEDFREARTTTGDEGWRIYYGGCISATKVYCTPLWHLSQGPVHPRSEASIEEMKEYLREMDKFAKGLAPRQVLIAPVETAPHWSRARYPCRYVDARIDWIEDARGWPLRCLMSASVLESFATPSTAKNVSLMWGIKTPLRDRFGAPRHIPLRPIWPGFAINTVFYAGVLWLLFAAPFALRRRGRIGRGLCPKCAYDLRGSPPNDAPACPECGADIVLVRPVAERPARSRCFARVHLRCDSVE